MERLEYRQREGSTHLDVYYEGNWVGEIRVDTIYTPVVGKYTNFQTWSLSEAKHDAEGCLDSHLQDLERKSKA